MSFLTKSMLNACVALMMFGAPPSYAQDARADYVGPWKQIKSNAGRCDRCEITIEEGADTLTVLANNGWSARLRSIRSGGRLLLQGRGVWNTSVSAGLRGREFDMSIVLVGNILHLEMKLPAATGRPQIVKAEFLRHWLGS